PNTGITPERSGCTKRAKMEFTFHIHVNGVAAGPVEVEVVPSYDGEVSKGGKDTSGEENKVIGGEGKDASENVKEPAVDRGKGAGGEANEVIIGEGVKEAKDAHGVTMAAASNSARENDIINLTCIKIEPMYSGYGTNTKPIDLTTIFDDETHQSRCDRTPRGNPKETVRLG
ncbi:hypothetical protein P691DRAFT_783361, partial [Macrolepiota fuliginosa MF-IS2]